MRLLYVLFLFVEPFTVCVPCDVQYHHREAWDRHHSFCQNNNYSGAFRVCTLMGYNSAFCLYHSCICLSYQLIILKLPRESKTLAISLFLTDMLYLSLYFLLTSLAASVSITNSQKVCQYISLVHWLSPVWNANMCTQEEPGIDSHVNMT